MAAVVLLCRVDGNFGGVERFILTLARGLDRDRFKPVIVTIANEGELARQAHEHGIETEFIPTRSRLRTWHASRLLMDIAQQREAGLVHTFGLRSNALAARMRKTSPLPWIVRLPNINRFDYRNAVRGWLSHKTNNHFIRQADALQVISPQLETYVNGWSRPPSQVFMIPNGVDPSEYDPNRSQRNVRDEFRIPADAPIVGSAGRLDPIKGYDRLIRAFKTVTHAIPDARLMLIGDGPDRQRLEQVAHNENLQDHIIFTGYKSDVKPYLAAFSLFVCSSHSEGVPNAMLEAMAMGTPILSTRVGGIESVVDDDREGRLVTNNHPETLSHAINNMLSDPETLQTMSRAARERIVRDLSVENMVRRVERMYDCVL